MIIFAVAAALVVVLGILLALAARQADPVVAVGFAVVLAIVGGAMLIGIVDPSLRRVGGALLVFAIFASGAGLLGSVRSDLG